VDNMVGHLLDVNKLIRWGKEPCVPIQLWEERGGVTFWEEKPVSPLSRRAGRRASMSSSGEQT